MAENKKISQFTPATTVQDNDKIPFVRGNLNLYGNWQTLRNNAILNLKTITSDYSIQSTDRYTHIDISHSPSSALININLPKLSTYNGPPIKITNVGSDNGLSYINKNSLDSANILFNDEAKSTVNLYMRGDYVLVRSNGTYWIVEDYNINIEIGWQNRSDWTNVHIGNGVTYDNKSAAIDWTGKKFSGDDGFGTNTCICLYDSGGTGTAGELYFYNISGSLGYFTDGNTLTASDGSGTALVNEISGDSKDVDYNLYHGFDISFFNISINLILNSSASITNAYYNPWSSWEAAGNSLSSNYIIIDNNQCKLQSGATRGFTLTQDNGTALYIDTDDWFVNQKLKF